MSAEKIINEIKKDAEKEKKQIRKEIEQKIKEIKDTEITQAKQIAREIEKEGEKRIENLKKILISKSIQEEKKKILKKKEELIIKSFEKASEKIKDADRVEYEKFLNVILKQSKEKLGDNPKIKITIEKDKKIIEKQGFEVIGKINADAGIIAFSSDEKVSLDLTIHGIMDRKKEKLRKKIGGLLFS